MPRRKRSVERGQQNHAQPIALARFKQARTDGGPNSDSGTSCGHGGQALGRQADDRAGTGMERSRIKELCDGQVE
jgi:hypothetical protein